MAYPMAVVSVQIPESQYRSLLRVCREIGLRVDTCILQAIAEMVYVYFGIDPLEEEDSSPG